MKKVVFPSTDFPEELEWSSDDDSLRNISLIRSKLEEHFPDHIEFQTYFADFNEDEETIEWIAGSAIKTGRLTELADLESQERENIQNKGAALETLLKNWILDPDSKNKHPKDFELIENLLDYPEENSLFAGSFGGRDDPKYFPVRVGWGCKLKVKQAGEAGKLIKGGFGGTNTEDITRENGSPIEAETKEPETLIPEDNNKFTWFSSILLWLIIFILILFIAIKITPACGLRIFNQCVQEKSGFSSELAKIAKLELELTKKQKFCNAKPAGQEDISAFENEVSTVTENSIIEKRLTENAASFGALNFTLAWDTKDDLDLSVICPGGEKIGYGSPTKQLNGCGTLDIDRNNLRVSEIVNDPIEHIFVDEVTSGDVFSLEVRRFSTNGSQTSSVDFSLIVASDHVLKEFTGSVVSLNQPWKAEFNYEAQNE